jgi:tRNA1Val (adenine37-N6)-methyltransferase
LPAPFHFQQFSIQQENAAHPVGTDGVLLGAWANIENARNILDIGTGTGLIALMLAQRTAPMQSTITAIEPNPDSCHLAAGNIAQSPWADRMTLQTIAAQPFAVAHTSFFDLLVCNPPFFTENILSPHAGRHAARHSIALPPDDLVQAALRLLRPSGRLCVILPPQPGQTLCEKAAVSGLYCTRITRVRSFENSAIERLLLQFEYNPLPFRRDDLIIYKKPGQYSEAYKALTSTFYCL